jgi:hypothetical protein
MHHLDPNINAAVERASERVRAVRAYGTEANGEDGRQNMNQHNDFVIQQYAKARQAELTREANEWRAAREAQEWQRASGGRQGLSFGKRLALAATLAGGLFIAVSLALVVMAG